MIWILRQINLPIKIILETANETACSLILKSVILLCEKLTPGGRLALWKLTAQRVKHGREFVCGDIQPRPLPRDLLLRDSEEWGAVRVVTVPPAEIPRWQELCVFPFLLFVRYFISFRKEANGTPWSKIPCGEAPGCPFSPSFSSTD